jgi:hypothetical protein
MVRRCQRTRAVYGWLADAESQHHRSTLNARKGEAFSFAFSPDPQGQQPLPFGRCMALDYAGAGKRGTSQVLPPELRRRVGGHAVEEPPGEYFTTVPIDDGDQIQEAARRGQLLVPSAAKNQAHGARAVEYSGAYFTCSSRDLLHMSARTAPCDPVLETPSSTHNP